MRLREPIAADACDTNGDPSVLLRRPTFPYNGDCRDDVMPRLPPSELLLSSRDEVAEEIKS